MNAPRAFGSKECRARAPRVPRDSPSASPTVFPAGLTRRRGFTLMEMLAVILMMAVVGGLLAMLLVDTLTVQRTQGDSQDRTRAQAQLADAFRADVARAESAPAEWAKFRADAHTLILRVGGSEHVVYFWDRGRLRRRVFAEGEEVAHTLSVGGEFVGVEFTRDGGLLRLRLPSLRGGNAAAGQTLEIVAALGGDRR
jgi:prepilin-type N-terminal cleavage/methylation domain-containing protein